MDKFTFNELNKLSSNALSNIRKKQLERIAENEEQRQFQIRQILALQNITDLSDYNKV